VVEIGLLMMSFVRSGHFEEPLEFTRYRLRRAYERVREHMIYGFDLRCAPTRLRSSTGCGNATGLPRRVYKDICWRR